MLSSQMDGYPALTAKPGFELITMKTLRYWKDNFIKVALFESHVRANMRMRARVCVPVSVCQALQQEILRVWT